MQEPCRVYVVAHDVSVDVDARGESLYCTRIVNRVDGIVAPAEAVLTAVCVGVDANDAGSGIDTESGRRRCTGSIDDGVFVRFSGGEGCDSGSFTGRLPVDTNPR